MRVPIGLSVLATAIATAASSAQTPSNVGDVLTRVGERIAEYYKRAQSVICIEKAVVQPIANFGPVGVARTTESELRIETGAEDGDGVGETKVVRVIRKINGRPPGERDRDKKHSSRCTDPNPLSPEPLEFLLPARRAEYVFTMSGRGKGQDRNLLIVDFKSVPTREKAELIEASNGVDDCYGSKGDIPSRGRVWVDAASFDILRVEEHVIGPVDIRVPEPLRRKRNLADWMVIERMDRTLRFKRIAFKDPDELVLLPESIEDVTLWRGGMQSTRRSHVFSDYRRFVTGARLVK